MIRVYYDPIFGCTGWDFTEPIEYIYHKDKSKWVSFKGGKEKVKLRKYIDDKALMISSLMKCGKNDIKNLFIEAYCLGGMTGLELFFQKSLIKALSIIKAERKWQQEKKNQN